MTRNTGESGTPRATDANLPGTTAGTSVSGETLAVGDVTALTEDTRRLNVSVDGSPMTEIRLFDGTNDLADVDALATRIAARVNAIDGVGGFSCTNNAGVLECESGNPGRRSSVVFRNASSQSAAAALSKLHRRNPLRHETECADRRWPAERDVVSFG